VQEANGEHYRLVAPPFGDDGLKVDDARTLVELLGAAPVGDKQGALVLGPLDRTTPEASDALLKTLEDFGEGPTRVFAWAWDLSGVSRTVRSRTLAVWCPGTDPLAHLKGEAQTLYAAWGQRRTNALVECLTDAKDDLAREDLLLAFLTPLAQENTPRAREAWARLRPLFTNRGVSRLAATSALLGLEGTAPLLLSVRGGTP
jgi:hypothetical protein